MNLGRVFHSNGYKNIIENPEENKDILKFFSDESTFDQVMGIFLSTNADEIFIVYKSDGDRMKEMYQKWDARIMFFLNHSGLDRSFLSRVELNIVQIILCDSTKKIDYSIETSLDVSRKIVIPYDCKVRSKDINNIEINEADIYLLPFVKVRQISNSENVELKEKLNGMIPEGDEYEFMKYKISKKPNRIQGNKSVMSLGNNQYTLIEEWINNDEN